MLQMQGISKSFGGVKVLDQVTLQVESGQALALLGENGAGKSTLMKILSSAYSADSGSILLDGKELICKNPQAARAAGVAMIYQELSLAPDLSVMQNILLGNEKASSGFCHDRAMNKQAREALDLLGHGDLNLHTKVSELSISLRQVIEIARALTSGCKVLVLDEPTSSLTPEDTEFLFKTIERLKESGLAIIYISHFLEEIFQICEAVHVLRDGVTALYEATEKTSTEKLIEAMVGRNITELYPRSERQKQDLALSCRNLSALPAPIDVSLEVSKGEIVGVAGLVGSGRTETLETLFGLRAKTSGAIEHFKNTVEPSIANSWASGLGFLSEDRAQVGLATDLSVAENITLAQLAQRKLLVRFSRSATTTIAEYWIEKLGIKTNGPWQVVRELSGGNQQKIAIARILHCESIVLLLDEPTKGVDAGSKAQIYALLDELVSTKKNTRAILVTSSYLPELLGICDRIYSMYRGGISSSHNVIQANKQELMTEICGGLDV